MTFFSSNLNKIKFKFVLVQTWFVDHVLSVFVREFDAGGDDGPAEPLGLDLAGFVEDPFNRKRQTIDAGIERTQILAQNSEK